MANQKVNIALIPARYVNQRIPLKNKTTECNSTHTYTIQSALKSNVFEEIIVSTDHSGISKIARDWGASVPEPRSAAYSGKLST